VGDLQRPGTENAKSGDIARGRPVRYAGRESGNYRWVVCALLFFATTVNYIDRQILSLLKPILDDQLKWSNEEFGMINGAFQAAYGVSMLLFGWFIDKYGTKIGYAVSIAVWSIAAAGHALVSSVGGFLAARVCLGLGEAGNFPSAIKAVAFWFPKKDRALATSIFNSGSNVGAIIAPAIVPWIAFTLGWQAAFIAAGVAGLVWLSLWLPFYDIPEKIKRLKTSELEYIHSDADESEIEEKTSWIALLKYREVWAFIAAKFFTDPIWWFFLIWLPDFFKQTRGLDIRTSWIHLVTIYTIVTALSIVGGWLTGYLAKRGWTITRARKTGMFIFALLVAPIFFVTNVGDWTAVVLIGLAGAAHQAWSANLFTTTSDIFPRNVVASITSVGGMAGAISGMFFPIITGRVLGVFKASGNVTGGYSLLFAFCAIIYLVTFGIHHVLAPRFEPRKLMETI
jgi:ACS family hexuronate transporter-like MFS transporter